MNIYGNYINESVQDIEQQILDEGVGIDLYTKFHGAKKFYREQKYYLEDALDHGDIKEAKSIIKKIITELTKVGKEVKATDDSEFTAKVGIFGIQTLEFFTNSIADILVDGGVAGAKEVIMAKVVDKVAIKGIKVAKSIGVSAGLALVKTLYKEISKQLETHQRMQYKIHREMEKNHKTEEEAKKAVGSIYKNEILDYLFDIISDLNKLDRGLKI